MGFFETINPTIFRFMWVPFVPWIRHGIPGGPPNNEGSSPSDFRFHHGDLETHGFGGLLHLKPREKPREKYILR